VDYGPANYQPNPVSNPESRQGWRNFLIVAAILAVFLLLGGFVLFAETQPDSQRSVEDADRYDPEAGPTADSDENQPDSNGGAPGGVEAQIPFQPDSIAVGGRAVWVSDFNCGVVAKIDLNSNEVVGVITAGGSTSGVTYVDGSVWVGNRIDSAVSRVNPITLEFEARVSIPGVALGLATDETYVWAVDPVVGAVHQIDPRSSGLLSSTPVGLEPHYAASGGGSTWVTNSLDGTVTRIDDTDASIGNVTVGTRPMHVIVADDSAWVTDIAEATVIRLDLASGEVIEVIEVGGLPHALSFANETIWVGTEIGELWKIDPKSNEVTRVAGVRFDSIDMDTDGTDIWIADSNASEVVLFDAVTAQVASRIDMTEFGDCDAFRNLAPLPSEVVTRTGRTEGD